VADKSIVDLQLGLWSQDERWDAQIWARHLFNTHVDALIFNSVFQGGSFGTFLGPPRISDAYGIGTARGLCCGILVRLGALREAE